MRVAVDLRPLLTPHESGVTVYTKKMVKELLLRNELELDLFYQARERCESIHQIFPQVRHVELSNTGFHLRSLFGFPELPKGYFPVQPDLIWLPDRRPFYRGPIPVVMTIHDQVPERYGRTLSLKGRLWHRVFSFSRLQSLCSGFLFPSLTVAHQVRSRLPWEVTYEGADLSIAQKPKGLPFDKDFVFSLAPLDPRKRSAWVLEMAKRFPKTRFVCAGIKTGDRRFSSTHLLTRPNVTFLGALTEEEKAWLFRHATVFLALSEYEGFDLPVLEAVRAKTPVILSDIGVHQELYKKAVFVKNLKELQGALYGALQGNGKIPELRGSYTWKQAAQRASLFFFRVLLNENRQGGGHGNRHNHPHHP